MNPEYQCRALSPYDNQKRCPYLLEKDKNGHYCPVHGYQSVPATEQTARKP